MQDSVSQPVDEEQIVEDLPTTITVDRAEFNRAVVELGEVALRLEMLERELLQFALERLDPETDD